MRFAIYSVIFLFVIINIKLPIYAMAADMVEYGTGGIS
jgi:hypothetical protein